MGSDGDPKRGALALSTSDLCAVCPAIDVRGSPHSSPPDVLHQSIAVIWLAVTKAAFSTS